MAIIAKIFPNGEFTAGEYHPKRTKGKANPLLFTRHTHPRLGYRYWIKKQPEDIPGNWQYIRTGMLLDWNGHRWSVDSVDKGVYRVRSVSKPHISWVIPRFRAAVRSGEVKLLASPPLGSSTPPKSSQRVKRGENGISSYSRRQVRNACFMLERQYGKDNLSFLTLTVPAIDNEEEQERLLTNWSKLTAQILNWLRKRLKRQGIDMDYVLVTEIQEKRYDRTSEIAPHLHVVFNGRAKQRGSRWAITPRDVRQAWARCLSRCVFYRPFTTKALENIQRIKHSASAYLGKYLSKGYSKSGKGLDGQSQGAGGVRCWASYSRGLGRLVSRALVRISDVEAHGFIARAVLTRVEELLKLDVLAFAHSFEIPLHPDYVPGQPTKPPLLLASVGRFKLTGGHIDWGKVSASCQRVLVGV